MQFNRLLTVVVTSITSFALLSCDQGSAESKIAKAIKLSVSATAIVLPTDLSNETNQTCMANGVTGPRVRLRAAIAWTGVEGGVNDLLIPLTVSLSIKKGVGVGDSEYNSAIGTADDKESLSILFGITSTDYVPADGTVYSSNLCFLDYGSLPEPDTELSGSAQQYVPATIRMMGIVRNAVTQEETPFVKEVTTRVLYVAGSIPTSAQ